MVTNIFFEGGGYKEFRESTKLLSKFIRANSMLPQAKSISVSLTITLETLCRVSLDDCTCKIHNMYLRCNYGAFFGISSFIIIIWSFLQKGNMT